jgi:hypothetical protein
MPATTSAKQGMSSKDRMIGIIAVLAVLIAVIVIYKVWAAQQVQVAISIPGAVGSSEKGQAMKAMKEKGATGEEESPSDLINPSKATKR